MDNTFKLGRKIGEGSFGEVFLGSYIVNPKTGEKVASAIKKVPADSIDFDEVEHLRALSQSPICNKHVVCLYDTVKRGGDFFIAMEFIDGPDLNEAAMHFETSELPRLFNQALRGLKYIHSKGMAHGDIRRENMMFDTQAEGGKGRIKYIDFGLTCSHTDTCIPDDNIGVSAPEVSDNDLVADLWDWDFDKLRLKDYQAMDRWALGTVLLELLLTAVRGVLVVANGFQSLYTPELTLLESNEITEQEKRNYPKMLSVINGLTRADPRKRMSIDKAISKLK